jgi:citrate lyase subunit beta/citryl-CoA lyase
MTLRSYLYVPGNRPDRLESSLRCGADAIIVDLEDAVAPDRKQAARDAVADWVANTQWPGELWVRVNPGPLRETDVRTLARAPITGLCLAKTANRAEVEHVAAILDALGSTAALAPILETATTVMDARAIASAPRVQRLQLGEADLRSELGIEPSDDDRELLHLRSHVVLSSAAAGIDQPLAPAGLNFRDLAAYEASTYALRRLGFFGRACIHPAQVPVANTVFTPTTEEVAAAQRILAALSEADGAVTATGGMLIDEAVARQARRTILNAQRAGQHAKPT